MQSGRALKMLLYIHRRQIPPLPSLAYLTMLRPASRPHENCKFQPTSRLQQIPTYRFRPLDKISQDGMTAVQPITQDSSRRYLVQMVFEWFKPWRGKKYVGKAASTVLNHRSTCHKNLIRGSHQMICFENRRLFVAEPSLRKVSGTNHGQPDS